jgi:hypothetical protein
MPTPAVTSSYSKNAVFLMVVFFLIATICIGNSIGILIYNLRRNYIFDTSLISVLVVAVASIVIACIPFMYKAPVVPIVNWNSARTTVYITNYNEIEDTSKLELWDIANSLSNEVTYNTANHSINIPDKFFKFYNDYKPVVLAVRNYKAGLVYSQSIASN